MGVLTLFIMRMAFLAILWIFVFVVVVALRSDLFGQRVRKLPATETGPSIAPPARTAPSAGGVIASRLVITAGANGDGRFGCFGSSRTLKPNWPLRSQWTLPVNVSVGPFAPIAVSAFDFGAVSSPRLSSRP